MDALQYSIPVIRYDRALPESDISLLYVQYDGICFFLLWIGWRMHGVEGQVIFFFSFRFGRIGAP